MAENGLQFKLQDDQGNIYIPPKKVKKPTSEEKKRYAREYYQANKQHLLEIAMLKRRKLIGLGSYAFIND